MLLHFIFILFLLSEILNLEACSSRCNSIDYKPFLKNNKFLSRLPDRTKLKNIGLIGTHHSLSYVFDNEMLRTQDLTISQQLNYGVRVLDVGFSREFNLFEIFMLGTPLNINLSDVLREMDKFLSDNPAEFLILFIRQIFFSESTESNCHVLRFYVDNFYGGNRLITNWTLKDTIGQYRGKILMASIDPTFTDCAFDLREQCDIQGEDSGPKSISLFEAMSRSFKKKNQCYVNNFSYSDKLNSPRSVAYEKGLTGDKLCPMPLNLIMAQKFRKPNDVMVIVLADYVTQELIDRINNCNFPKYSWRTAKIEN